MNMYSAGSSLPYKIMAAKTEWWKKVKRVSK